MHAKIVINVQYISQQTQLAEKPQNGPYYLRNVNAHKKNLRKLASITLRMYTLLFSLHFVYLFVYLLDIQYSKSTETINKHRN